MHTPIRTRKSARVTTIAAQAAAMVLLLSAVGMGAFGLPGLGMPETPVAPAGGAEGQPGEEPEQPGRQYVAVVDPETVDYSLGMIKNHPVPDPEPGPDEVVIEDDPEIDSTPGVRYVGSIKVGGRAAAFMNIGGITKLLRPGGAEYEGVRLVRVDEGSVVVSIRGGDEQEIEKTERVGPAVSVVLGGAPEPVKDDFTAVAEDSPQAPNFTPDMSREERRQMLLDRARTERGRWERQRGEDGGPPN
ncbi:MAG: hypothetical protein IT431_04575 [Phycisphaerales bacterium]|nr:hypothetical protein [Phycisphaerales bacterium]